MHRRRVGATTRWRPTTGPSPTATMNGAVTTQGSFTRHPIHPRRGRRPVHRLSRPTPHTAWPRSERGSPVRPVRESPRHAATTDRAIGRPARRAGFGARPSRRSPRRPGSRWAPEPIRNANRPTEGALRGTPVATWTSQCHAATPTDGPASILADRTRAAERAPVRDPSRTGARIGRAGTPLRRSRRGRPGRRRQPGPTAPETPAQGGAATPSAPARSRGGRAGRCRATGRPGTARR